MKYSKISIIIKAKPPYFIGSEIRGALGYALKSVVCINPSYNCKDCFASSSCLYYSFYEEKNVYHKYRLNFELGKDYYDYDFYLFDDATLKLPYIISAFSKMITQNGLGKNKLTFKNFDLYINDNKAIINDKIKLPSDTVKTVQINDFSSKITLKLITPLRIKQDNQFVRDDSIRLKSIINSIYQRQMKILNKDYEKFPYEIKGDIIQKKLKYQELTRRSNRQKSIMNLGGIIGSITINNLNQETFNILKLGETIGAGKQNVFGLGSIKIDKIS